MIEHEGLPSKANFSMKVVSTHKTALSRQETEGVRIKEIETDITMNSQGDWHQPPLVRVVPSIETGNQLVEQVGSRVPNVGRAVQRGGTQDFMRAMDNADQANNRLLNFRAEQRTADRIQSPAQNISQRTRARTAVQPMPVHNVHNMSPSQSQTQNSQSG